MAKRKAGEQLVKAMSHPDLSAALEQDLAGHTTQGAHGINYHHRPASGDGSIFFMPNKSLS
jgi:hypothetical protein